MLSLADLLLGTVPIIEPPKRDTRRRESDDEQHPKLLQAQQLLKDKPGMSRRELMKTLHVDAYILRLWVARGWIKFAVVRTYGPKKSKVNVKAIKAIKEQLAADASLPATVLATKSGVSASKVRKWAQEGHFAIRTPPRTEAAKHWISHGGWSTGAAYDPMMVPARKD